MPQLFANNAYSSLGATLSAVSTSLTLATGHGARFPSPTGGDHFLLTLVGLDGNGNENAWEIVSVTGRASDALTVVRGQESTTAALWAAGTRVEMRATKGTYENLLQLTGGTLTGDLAFSGSGRKITGDFSNATLANRVMIQSSTMNGNTAVTVVPNGTATTGTFRAYNAADPTNASFIQISAQATSMRVESGVSGTGTYRDLVLLAGASGTATLDTTGKFTAADLAYTGTLTGGTGVVNLGSGQVYKDASGNVGIGTASPATGFKLTLNGDQWWGNGAGTELGRLFNDAGVWHLRASSNVTGLAFGTNGTEKARIDSAGNLTLNNVFAGSPGLSISNSKNLCFAEDIGWGYGNLFRQASTGDLVIGSGVAYKSGGGYASSTPNAWARSAIHVGYGGIKFYTAAEATVAVGSATTLTQAMTLDSSGNLLIGTTTAPGSSGSSAVRKGSTGQLILVADSGGLYHQAVSSYYVVTTAGGSTSDENLKTNVNQLSGALEKICAIRGVHFEFIEQPLCTADQGLQLGVIAQEVEAQYPEIVLTDENGIKTVRYDRLVAPLIEAVKEQQTQIEAMQAQIDEQNAAMQLLADRLAALEAK